MMNLMIVEDEVLVRMGLRTLVEWEKSGFTLAAEAKDGAEALEILKQKKIDIIITDIRMPVMDGITMIKEIRSRQIECEIVILSSYDDFEYVKQAMVLEARDYLHKPTMMPDDIIATLTRVAQEIKKKREQKGVPVQNTLNYVCKELLKGWFYEEETNKEYFKQAELMDIQKLWFNLQGFCLVWEDDLGDSKEIGFKIDDALHQIWQQYVEKDTKFQVYLRLEQYVIFLCRDFIEVKLQERIAEQVQELLGKELVWEQIPYKVTWSNLPEVVPILHHKLETAYEEKSRMNKLSSNVSKTVMIVKERFADNNLSLEGIASEIYINPSYLSKVFLKEMKQSFVDYLTEQRLSHARKLLKQTTLPIREIAVQSGYINEKYFMKLFKKNTGMTPGDYRNIK
jgi:two-component system, response regulator YesN